MKLLKMVQLGLVFMPVLAQVSAAPHIGTDQYWVRKDVELLANAGIISTPITTWPLPWSDITLLLQKVDVAAVDEKYLPSLNRLKWLSKSASRKQVEVSTRLSVDSEVPVFQSFGKENRAKNQADVSVGYLGDRLYGQLAVSLFRDEVNGDELSFENSQLAINIDNWLFGVGYINRWWGPGWRSSLIVSNNARARPGLYFSRNYSSAFDSKWLSWIGPWHVTGFIEELDDERSVADAKHFGLSFTFKPHPSLEIGFRRTAQWGGEGREQSAYSFWNMLIGNDNCILAEDGGCVSQEREAGNQIAGIDMRWSFASSVADSSIYLQVMGEDEAGYLPSKKFYVGGVSTSFSVGDDALLVLSSEYTNTASEGTSKYNVVYEHSIYLSGYRYEGRAIGSTFDNDSTALGLNLELLTTRYGHFGLSAESIKLNRDGTDIIYVEGGHSITSRPIDIQQLGLRWHYKWANLGTLSLRVVAREQEPVESPLLDDVSFGLQWERSY